MADGNTIYLAHAHEDNATTDRVERDLRLRGLSVWYDRDQLLTGEDMVRGMNEGLGAYDFFLVAWSKHAAASGWVEREISTALVQQISDQRRLIPLLLDDTPLPPLLRAVKYVDLRSDYDAGFRQLVDTLTERFTRGSALQVETPPSETDALPHAGLRLELFKLREDLWLATRLIAGSAGGFAGLGLMSAPSLAGFTIGYGRYWESDGEALRQSLSDFWDLCQVAFNDQNIPADSLNAAIDLGKKILAEVQEWLEHHPPGQNIPPRYLHYLVRVTWEERWIRDQPGGPSAGRYLCVKVENTDASDLVNCRLRIERIEQWLVQSNVWFEPEWFHPLLLAVSFNDGGGDSTTLSPRANRTWDLVAYESPNDTHAKIIAAQHELRTANGLRFGRWRANLRLEADGCQPHDLIVEFMWETREDALQGRSLRYLRTDEHQEIHAN